MQYHVYLQYFIIFLVVIANRNKPLTETELEEIAERFCDSEDGFDFFDTDSSAVPEYIPNQEELYDDESVCNENEETTSTVANNILYHTAGNFTTEENIESDIISENLSPITSKKNNSKSRKISDKVI